MCNVLRAATSSASKVFIHPSPPRRCNLRLFCLTFHAHPAYFGIYAALPLDFDFAGRRGGGYVPLCHHAPCPCPMAHGALKLKDKNANFTSTLHGINNALHTPHSHHTRSPSSKFGASDARGRLWFAEPHGVPLPW
eukprot:scaffold232859_cov36-Tisochrysis_lutea.AAC.4